ncbi:threonine/serine exporter family protein [Bifidobacterium sp. 82T10]|uniref:Threonine/serine exporter family protein n=1 Tax=Bifidobacterium miconis TaxID=2834435 RepID=A0ABS6WFV7_9BIFI|nr:threonine/serine exporter family protein [Bifidobacterium miconis]MBW3092938.1 threonine/serine exporter family protein [Bifidobacterium miconis]
MWTQIWSLTNSPTPGGKPENVSQGHQYERENGETSAAAVQHFHTHSIPLDMEDIERDWDKPITEAGIAAKASVIVRVGLLDLSAGTGSFRVREMMHRIAYPLGVHVRADVNLTDIEAACTDGKDRITEVIDLPTTGVNTERIWLLEHFADWFSVNLGEDSMYHTRSEVSSGLMQHLDSKDASQVSAQLAKKLREEEKLGKSTASAAAGPSASSGTSKPGQDAVLDALEIASQHADPGDPRAHQLHVHETDWSQSAMTQSLAARAAVAQAEEHAAGEAAEDYRISGDARPVVEDVDHADDVHDIADITSAGSGRGTGDSAPDDGRAVATESYGPSAKPTVNDAAATDERPVTDRVVKDHVKHHKAPDSGFLPSEADARKHAHKPPKGEYAAHFDHVGKTRASRGAGITVRQAHQRLDMIERRKPLYSPAFAGLASAIACASFVFLLGGGPYDMVGAFVGAGLGHWLRRLLFKHHLNQFFVTFVCVAVAALACTGTLRLIGLFDPVALQHDTAYIGAMLFVIPGFPLITGGLDMAKIDFPSGVQRVTYVLCIILMATLAGWMVATIVHLNPQGFEPLGLNPWVNMLLRALFAFLGVWGFSVMFNSPQRMCLTAAVIGMITDTLRLEIVDMGVPAEAGAFIGAFLAGILATVWRSSVRKGWLPPHLGYPRICLTVPSIVIMVPGMYMYRAMWYLGSFQTLNALDWAFRAFMVIICLPIGLAMARVITDKSWRYDI